MTNREIITTGEKILNEPYEGKNENIGYNAGQKKLIACKDCKWLATKNLQKVVKTINGANFILDNFVHNCIHPICFFEEKIFDPIEGTLKIERIRKNEYFDKDGKHLTGERNCNLLNRQCDCQYFERKDQKMSGEQGELIETAPRHINEIAIYARHYQDAMKQRKKAFDDEIELKHKILDLIKQENLQPIDGTIHFTVEGFSITVTPREDNVQIKEVTQHND